MSYIFEVIEKSWHKRRAPDVVTKTVINVEIPDFKLEANHMCKMQVSYSDGSEKLLLARVIQNQITKEWKVDGLEVAVRVVLSR